MKRGHRLHRIWHRDRYRSCLVCRFVWWRLMRQPGFRAAMERIDEGIQREMSR